MSTVTLRAAVCAAVVFGVGVVYAGLSHAASAAAADGAVSAPEIAPEERLKRNQVTAENAFGDGEFRKEQEKAIGGDRDAAFRVAQMFKSGSNGVPRDDKRMVQWLLHASLLNHAAASYQLYQHFLELRLDRDAVFFENRAIEQGYTPPPRLDPRRG